MVKIAFVGAGSFVFASNHQSWLLEITDDGRDLYPEIKRRAVKMNREGRRAPPRRYGDMVRFEMMAAQKRWLPKLK